MAKGLLGLLLGDVTKSEYIGTRGEKLIHKELNIINLFGRSGKVLKNVYIPTDNETTTEIDLLYITQKGIFVIESKNYSGWIFGNEASLNWTCTLPTEKNTFYNPIKQNQTHIRWLKNYLNDKIPYFSIIVFSERCELKEINLTSSDIHVVKRDSLYATVRNIWNNSEDVISEEIINSLYNILNARTKVDNSVKIKHVEDINKNLENAKSNKTTKTEHNKTTEPTIPLVTEPTIPSLDKTVNHKCPNCNSPLILREAKKGANAGN